MPKKDKSLIIFDCDGVIRSASWEGLFKSYITMAEYLGKDYKIFFRDMTEFKKWWDPDWKKTNKALGIIDYEADSAIFYKCYEPYISLFPWVPNVLKQLSQKYVIAMLTNGSSERAKKFLGRMTEYFSLIAGSEHIKKLKPDPEGINLILKKLNLAPSDAIMIGDMKVDVSAGRNAETKTGVVNWGLGELNELTKLNPDYVFKKPEDLLSLL